SLGGSNPLPSANLIAPSGSADGQTCPRVARRGGRGAEGAALEMPCTGNRTVGSNPTPSANLCTVSRRETVVINVAGWREGVSCEAAPDGGLRGVHSVRRAGHRGRQRSRWPLIGNRQRWAVLDGEVAVPCNPQSAIAGLNSLSRAGRVE